jgi:hypothetical protein
LAPFNLGSITVFYSISEEGSVIQLRLRRFF